MKKKPSQQKQKTGAKRTRKWLLGWYYLFRVRLVSSSTMEEFEKNPNLLLTDPRGGLIFEESRRERARENIEAVCKRVYQELGNPGGLFDFISIAGEEALKKEWAQEEIRKWRGLLDPGHNVAKEDRALARSNLRRVGSALATVLGSGRPEEITEQERESIIAS